MRTAAIWTVAVLAVAGTATWFTVGDRTPTTVTPQEEESAPAEATNAPASDPDAVPEPPPGGGVRIAALLPNPAGEDRGNETITLVNHGDHPAALDGWSLLDRAENQVELSGSIAADESRIIVLNPGQLPLNNSGDEITLLDENGRTIDRVSYTASQAGDGKAIVFAEFDATESLTICSFNIQFLGNSEDRDDVALASILRDYDIVVVQELVSPPYPDTFPNGEPVNPDPQSAEFFDAMAALGFDYVLSQEDTGTGDAIHRNGSTTEWWVTFFKPGRVRPASDLPSGFLAADRSNHDDYERVPYAFAFRTPAGRLDFVLVSVHLKPGDSTSDAQRRNHELASIAAWIDEHDDIERDFLIVGDMNIQDAAELADATPTGFQSLNDESRPTNTNVNGPKPYDHVMYNPTFTGEIDEAFDFQVVDLVDAMEPFWTSTEPYPGEPYDHNAFRRHFSDHHPIVFRMAVPETDDD